VVRFGSGGQAKVVRMLSGLRAVASAAAGASSSSSKGCSGRRDGQGASSSAANVSWALHPGWLHLGLAAGAGSSEEGLLQYSAVGMVEM
jgi:hypothetical protein